MEHYLEVQEDQVLVDIDHHIIAKHQVVVDHQNQLLKQ